MCINAFRTFGVWSLLYCGQPNVNHITTVEIVESLIALYEYSRNVRTKICLVN